MQIWEKGNGMGLKDRIVGALFGGEIEKKVGERLKAASVLDAPNVESLQWRRLTTNAERDLLPAAQDRMIEIAYWLWETNPLAGWLIDITTSFILAEGLPYEAKNEEVKGVLDGFWNDPVNRMPLFFPKHVGEMHIYGELCFPAFTAEQTGRIRLGFVDPAQIEAVITDPENCKMQIGVLTKKYVGDIGGIHVEANPKKYRIILPEEAEFILSSTAKQLRDQFSDGECFFYAINNVTNSPRGRSSLLAVADWLDAYEQFLFDYADRWPLLNTFVWDLMVQGADEAEIKKQVQNFTKKSGSVFGHNEKVILNPAAPDIKAAQAGEGARIFRNHIMGRFGYPEHWYGGGGDVNRATASEMDLPAIKMLSQKQNFVAYMLEDILGQQIRRARASGFLRVSDDEAKFSVITPKMEAKDISKFGSMVQQVGAALVSAETQEWIDKDTARKLFATIMGFAGVDIDLEEVKKKIEEEQTGAGYEDYRGRKAQGNGNGNKQKTSDGLVGSGR
jgi:hypothetical protein